MRTQTDKNKKTGYLKIFFQLIVEVLKDLQVETEVVKEEMIQLVIYLKNLWFCARETVHLHLMVSVLDT